MEHNESSSSRDIQFAIRQLAGVLGLKQATFVTANVDSVQEADRTLTVTTILGESSSSITGVNLQSEPNDGFILIPKVDTEVIVCIMPDNSAYMFKCNDVDKIICVIDSTNSYIFDTNGFVWNGGTNGGLTNINILKTALNNLQTEINTLKTATATAITVYSGILDSGASAGVFNAIVLPQINITTIEDTKIKH